MTQIIVYPNDSGTVAILAPAPDADINSVAAGWVPEGKPWRIVEREDLPGNEEWLWSAEGPIVAAPPSPPAVPDQISFAQAVIGMVAVGWITEQEGRDWRDRIRLPASIKTVIDMLPVEQRFAAETRALAPSTIERTNPLLGAFAASQGKSDAEVDNFFRYCSTI